MILTRRWGLAKSIIIKTGGIVISFGWNSTGIGKKYGFEKKKIKEFKGVTICE